METKMELSARTPQNELINFSKKLSETQLTVELLDLLPNYTLILNKHRQILFANKLFRDEFGESKDGDILGKRIGEALGCVHSSETPAGCGTAKACDLCGALTAVVKSQQLGADIKESIITLRDNNPLNVKVWAKQKIILGQDFTVVSLIDISDQIRKLNLEKIFYHDVLNTAGGLKGMVDLLNDADENELKEYLPIVSSFTDNLIDEIKSQRLLTYAEHGELIVNKTNFESSDILNEIKLLFTGQKIYMKKQVIFSCKYDVIISTDKLLLKRVLYNLLKNALEATKEGDSVILECAVDNEDIVFTVSNKNVIPEDVQLRLFQRSFSTKGTGRGYGTYSVKLLTENYLNGKVSFTSNPQIGTKFTIKLPVN